MNKKITIAQHISNFIYRILYNFYNTNGTTRAGSLSFTLLLSFIPFTITIAGLIGKLPFSNRYITEVEQYLFLNDIPHDGMQFYQHVKIFLQHSNNLSLLGFSSLMITSFLMLFSVENQLNGLWSSRTRKFSFLNSLILYFMFIILALATLAGLLILSLYSHVFLKSQILDYVIDKTLTSIIAFIMFFLCYKIMPNHKVKYIHAIIAASVATLIFGVLKIIFVTYTQFIFVNYHIIYGSLAVIPISLIWIYINCLNLLFSAELILGLEEPYNHKIQTKFNAIVLRITLSNNWLMRFNAL